MTGRAQACDVAVVGAGIVGLAAAHELRARGATVRVFEAARPGAGQSAGSTRIFRHSHVAAEMVRLAAESRPLWDEWEAAFGRRLVGHEGVLVTGPEARRHEARLRAAGLRCRLVSEDEQRELLPALEPPGGAALLDERGGAIDVRAATSALSAALADSLVLGRVFAIEERAGGVVVESSEGVWNAERAVVCAGAEVGTLVPALHVDSGRHVRATFAVRDHLRERTLACLQEQSGEYGETVYGGPVPGENRFVVGLSGPGNAVPADPRRRTPGRDERVAELCGRICRWVERAMPGLDPEPVALRLCLTTILPEGHDNFRLWRGGPVTGLAGDNLFKFAPLLGRMLAEGGERSAASAARAPARPLPSRGRESG